MKKLFITLFFVFGVATLILAQTESSKAFCIKKCEKESIQCVENAETDADEKKCRAERKTCLDNCSVLLDE